MANDASGNSKTTLSDCDFEIETLGENKFDSPLDLQDHFWCSPDRRIIYNNVIEPGEKEACKILSFERVGPYKKIHFNPKKINVGIVTCGGLCPGLNDVIRAITHASYKYGVKNVYGFKYGYQGLTSGYADTAIRLDSDLVERIHEEGGTILGSSRGPQAVDDMVDTLVKFNISILFVIGGDGTQKGSSSIVAEITRRKLDISVIGIPKTIDNDISYIYKTFGFDTAVEEARKAIRVAHVEAKGAENGVGIVKLMGRDSGFIAAQATLCSGDVNVCLIPELPLNLDELLVKLKKRFEKKDHVVIVVAEGVGQELLYAENQREYDASGNLKLKDIGIYLKEKISYYLKNEKVPHTIRYLDPSYLIRSTPSNAYDAAFCLHLGNSAVHAGMAGKTNILVGYWNQHFALVPIKVAISKRKTVDINSTLWRTITEITI